jgi:predicted nuclease of restriction endonuclease-like RecB superfamily
MLNKKCPWNKIRNQNSVPKPHWQEYKNTMMRSSWEVNFAKWCDRYNITWQYEPKTFRFKQSAYTPDFYLPEFHIFIEIKGYFPSKIRQKLYRFKKFFPYLNLLVITEREYKKLCT